MRLMDRFLFFDGDGSVRELLESPYEDVAGDRMRRTLVVVVATAIVLPACSGSGAERPADPRATGPSAVADQATGSTGASSPSPTGVVLSLPEPDAWIPRRAGALAVRLETTWEARRVAIRRWVRTGDPDAWPPPEAVELLVLYEQRIYRVLAAHDRLAAAVFARLHAPWPRRRGRASERAPRCTTTSRR